MQMQDNKVAGREGGKGTLPQTTNPNEESCQVCFGLKWIQTERHGRQCLLMLLDAHPMANWSYSRPRR
jgi:hypothetical protein